MKDPTLEELIEQLFQNAPVIILRKNLPEITGNMDSIKSLANLDCLGQGIKPRLLIGGRVAYPKAAVISFYKDRLSFAEKQ